MVKTYIPLDTIRVASPCRVSWEGMAGDAAERFCPTCQNRVYNLSALSHARAGELLRNHAGGRLCVRFFRRPDGTVMTRDCPLSARAFRRLVVVVAGLAAALLLGLTTLGWSLVALGRTARPVPVRLTVSPWQRVWEMLFPRRELVMGDICPPAPPAPPGPPAAP